MLDFAFGQFGFGVSAGMQREQDRITQNRTEFAGSMARFLADNPYLSPEAAQAYINAAAGTDNTLRGAVPNQLIGEMNAESSRRRRIDTFNAFNEFMRLNPGATPAEFQAAMSTLGAQGIYGKDAIKAMQSRADQYRKDQEQKRLMDRAQEIGATRNAMMSDIEYQFLANGYDPVKTIKALKEIYGENPPIPYESLVNPGSAEMYKSKVIRDNLPKAVELMSISPNMTPEMLSGVFPALAGNPIIGEIYKAAKAERTKAIQSKFDTNRLAVIDTTVKLMEMGQPLESATQQAARSTDISQDELASLDLSAIGQAAQTEFDKRKSDKELAKRASLAKASANIGTAIDAMTANEVDAAVFASMTDAQLEQKIRQLVSTRSGLVQEEIDALPPQWYAETVAAVRENLNTRATMAQQKRYEASRGIETTVADKMRKDSVDSAAIATSKENLTFLGLKDAQSGGGVMAAVQDLATRYDMSNGRAQAAVQMAMEKLKSDPSAAANLTAALENDPVFQQTFRPITEQANQQADMARLRDGSDQAAPVGFTPWVQGETQKISQESDAYLSELEKIVASKSDPETKRKALEAFSRDFASDLNQAATAYGLRRESQHIWTQANDRWDDNKFSAVRVELEALKARVQVQVERAKQQIEKELAARAEQTKVNGQALDRPDDPTRSGLYNDLASIKPTPAQYQADVIAGELARYELGGSPAGYFYKSQEDQQLYSEIAKLAYSDDAIRFLYQRPDIYQLIDSRNPNANPRAFLDAFKREFNAQ